MDAMIDALRLAKAEAGRLGLKECEAEIDYALAFVIKVETYTYEALADRELDRLGLGQLKSRN